MTLENVQYDKSVDVIYSTTFKNWKNNEILDLNNQIFSFIKL